MKGRLGKRVRQESAIKRIEKQIEAHKADSLLTKRILEDKELKKTSDEIEKIRQKKISRLETTVLNTKSNMGR
tara:strand:- start:852 stop:1070 length:219 start_codon:yes stop_codon:yes gene_type:complete